MTEKTLTTENIRPALDALRGELAPWPVVAKKQDRLNTAQLNAANSGITSSLVAQIIANTAAIRALESAITGTGLRALVVSSLPAVGTTGILYIVPVTTYDPETDADVVNYSNEYIWIPVEAGQASEGHYEQVGQTGIVINNGQLTITVNGTSVGTFTANQSGDTTAAITVPTNADYVDRTTNQTIAGTKTFSSTIDGTASKAIADEDGTSIKTGYVNVAGTQSVSGQKTWSGNQFFTSPMYPKNTSYEIGNTPASNVAIPIYFTDKNNVYTGYVRSTIYTSGRTATEIRAKNRFKSGVLDPTGADISSNLNVEVQPNGTKTIYWDGLIRNDVTPFTTNNNALGTSTNQWSSVYAQTYYYNGTQWGLDKANVWTGNNTFKSANTNFRFQSTTAETGSTTASSNWMHWIDKNGYQDAYISRDFWNNGADTLRIVLSGKRSNGAPSTSGTAVECGIRLDIAANGSKSVNPYTNGDTDLGTSTNQWKTLNGINPGALSLPNLGANEGSTGTTYKQDISGDLAPDAYNNIRFTPRMDGWVYIDFNISSATPNTTGQQMSVQFKDNSLSAATYACNFAQTASSGHILIFMPVLQNHTITLEINFTGFSVNKAYVYPCLGNV